MPTPSVMIDQIDAQLTTLITTQEVDFKMGALTVRAGQKINQLLQAREKLTQMVDPDITFVAFSDSVDEFGTDNTEYVF